MELREKGCINKKIAEILKIKLQTISNHATRYNKKLKNVAKNKLNKTSK